MGTDDNMAPAPTGDTAAGAERSALNRARESVRQGDLKAARDTYADILRANRRNVDAWLEIAQVSQMLGAPRRALQCYSQAITLQPRNWRARLASAKLLEEAGRDDQAAAQYFLAVSTAGDEAGRLADIHHDIGRARLNAGKPGRALECFRQARLAADNIPSGDRDERVARIMVDFGDALARLNLIDDAARAFGEALQSRSQETLERCAHTAYRNNLWRQGIAALRRCVELDPQNGDARFKLVRMMSDCGQISDALAELDRSRALIPETAAMGLHASIAARMGDTREALDLTLRLVDGGQTKLASSAALNALYSDSMTPGEVLSLHKRLFADLGKGARPRGSFANDANPDRRLRIGMVTADLHRQHPVGILLQPVLKHLNRDRVHTTVYFVGAVHDEETHLARSRVDAWREMAGANAEAFKRQAETDAIDVMIDLAGHTGSNRMDLFAKRLAPVQATFLGYPGTTGVPNIDWLVADATVVPPEHDKLYSESVLRLPNTVFCYAPEADYPFPKFADDVAARPLTFGSFNNIPKLTEATVRLWARVLDAVDGSRLALKGLGFDDPAVVARYRELFAGEGTDDARLEFRGPVGLADMMAEYADIDIGLDPFPYNGGATTLQAMWMGAPVITRCGGSFVQRMGASFMGAAGLDDWVADDDDGYVRIAREKSRDRAALLELKRGMRERLLARPAWDIERYTRDFEAGLRQMWRQWCRARS